MSTIEIIIIVSYPILVLSYPIYVTFIKDNEKS